MNTGVLSTDDVVLLDGSCEMSKELIGGKAWGINRMHALDIPVPPAVVLTTRCCDDYYRSGRALDDTLWSATVDGVRELERLTGRSFGGDTDPLLVSVRSGAAISMPGMMDTVLNLGMTDQVEQALANRAGVVYAVDTRRRFDEQYRAVVLGGDTTAVPKDPWDQLRSAVAAVFDSWMSSRAVAYRKNRQLSDVGGTAVTIQAMVFGNLDASSGTGVLFSRNPLTGERPAYGEWLFGGQGEDVVSGRADPLPLDALRQAQPTVHADLLRHAERLEQLHRDIQDIEFTVESGKLWILQYRTAKRSARAAVRAAVAMAQEGLITPAEAIGRVEPDQVRVLLRPQLETPIGPPLFRGEPACPGIASGVVVTDADEAEERGLDGESVILARETTSPADLHGMLEARGVVTELGGATSHAAVVSREIDRPCVVGCGAGTVTKLAGQLITIDGDRGEIWPGALELKAIDEDAIADFAQLFAWASQESEIPVFRAGSAPAGVTPVDLNAIGPDWPAALTAAAAVTGTLVQRADVQRAIRAARPAFVVADPALPVLLGFIALQREDRAP